MNLLETAQHKRTGTKKSLHVKNPILTIDGSDILKRALPMVEKEDAIFFNWLTNEEKRCMIDIFQKLMLRD